uniref:Uncharacterized protein n=1 Tax=Acrobeloides nanus TaxID=290746 RepID=A0A914DJC1_9BILA
RTEFAPVGADFGPLYTTFQNINNKHNTKNNHTTP